MNTAKTLVIRTAAACTSFWARLVVLSVVVGFFAALAVPVHVR